MPETDKELENTELVTPKKRRRPPKVTDKELSEALINMYGLVSAVAAHFTMNGRPITDTAIRNRIKSTPAIAEACEAARAKFVDKCESRLLKAVENDDTTAIIFALKCLGKDRGYIERQQIEAKVENKNTGEIRILELPDNGRGNDEGKTAGDKRGPKRDKDNPSDSAE